MNEKLEKLNIIARKELSLLSNNKNVINVKKLDNKLK